MIFTEDKLKEARDAGYSDEEIWSHVSSADENFNTAKSEGYSLDEVATYFSSKKPEPREFFSFEDAVSAIGTIPEALAVGVPAAYQKLVTGLEIPEKSEAIESELAFQQRIQTEQEDRVASGKATSVGSAIRQAVPSLGFSVLPMAAAIPAGIGGAMAGGPAAPVTGPAAAMAASGTVAYRMAGSDMMYRAYKQLEEAKGSPLTNEEKAEYYKTVLPIAQNYGLWEAGPEAVSNAITMGVGKFVFGFGKQAAKKLVGESIDSANKTIARKVAEKGAAVAGGLGAEIASEGVTAVGQYPEEAKIRQLAATGEVSKGEQPSYPGGYIQAVKDVAPATIALYGMMGTAAGGVKLSTLPFRSQKTPEQIAEDNINIEADRVSRELSIGETDEETKSINAALETARNNLIAKKEVYTALEPNDPAAQSLGLEIREMEREVVALDNELKKRVGEPVSEPITEAERQQAELAKAIVEEPAPTEPLPVPPAPVKKAASTPPVLYHGGRKGMSTEDIQIVREPGATKQGKRGRVYGGFYTTEKLNEAEQYAAMLGEDNTVYEVQLNPSAVVETYAGDITRLSPQRIEEFRNRGVDIVVGKDVRGRTENVIINKEAVASFTDINKPPSAPVEQVVTPPVEVAPTIAEPAPITPAPVTEQAPPAEAPAPEVAPVIQRDVTKPEQKKIGILATLEAIRDGKLVKAYHGSRNTGLSETKSGSSFTTSKVLADKFAGKSGTTYEGEIFIPKDSPVYENAVDLLERIKSEDISPEEAQRQWEIRPNEIRPKEIVAVSATNKATPTPAVSETITEPVPTEVSGKIKRGSKRRRMADRPTPLPENERYGQVKLNRRVQKYFGGKIPARVYVVDDAVDPEYEYKAAYYPDLGILILNNAFIRKNENIGDIIAHELGHYAFGDKKFKAAFDKFYNSLSPEEKVDVDNLMGDAYKKDTEESQMEERKVIAFTSYTIATPQRRTLWNAVLDAMKAFANKFLGKNFEFSDPTRTALAMLATAKKRFAAGEEIVREEEEGPLKMAARREQIMGEKVGPEVKTPEGIIAKTQELLRKQFDPTKVSEKNTTEAFRAIGRLTSKQGNAFAEELNDLGRVEGSEVSMGAALFVNDLFEYSIRLAADGNKKMLGIMMSNINKLPTGAMGATGAGQTLRARLELSQRFLTMAQAEQDAYTNYVAEFIYGPNPTKDQIQSIKDAYAAVDKTPQVTEQGLTDELESVGGRTGTDLVGKIKQEFTKATEKGKEQRKTEEAELDTEYKKVQKQADAEIEKLAKIQSDTPSFDPAAARQITNDVRAIVSTDLKQKPDMGRKAPWKSMLVAKLQEAGVELTAAETLADIVWRQHEINSLSRELSSINKAIEKGPISEIVKAIKDTPLEDQQNPNWRYEVMRDYLRRAGLNVAQSERIAKLMDISLQKRFTMAQEEAFTQAISKSAPWKTGDTRSRRAFQKVLQALRAGALDPARNVLSDMAALNGWTGFTPEQYKDLLKYDAILSDPKSAKATKAEAHKAIQNIISKAKLPIRARDVIGQYYDAQALSGITTMTVNIFSPAGVAVRNALIQSLNGLVTARPEQITAAMTTFVDSIKSWANTVAFSFKNNVTVYSNVEYLVNDEGLLKLYNRGVDQFNNGKTPRERADGVKNMMIGMMDYVRRVLNALDYGAIAAVQNQAVSKYALAVMQAKGMSSKDGAKMLNAMMEQKRNFYTQQIAIGTDKNKAAVLADEFFISAWEDALTKEGVEKSEIKKAMDAALNDAMSAVGRNRQSLDSFLEEETNIRDEGLLSFPAIWLLETMANAANKQDNQFIKIFSRVIYGFAIIPARVLRDTAWFSPIGAYRFAYEYIAEKKGLKSRYAQSLGNDLQYRQRLTETITGSIVMLAFAAAMSSSTEDEEDEKPFKIVVTGNGPLRSEDPQYYDSWTKKNKANTVSLYFGKTKFTINTMRGFEAFAWPAMMLGAVDDWHIRRKQGRTTNTPLQMQDAAIVAGNVLSASLRRGPYAFAAKPLFEAYGDRGVESLAKSLAFPAKTIVPVLGSSLASNISNFLNEPVDRRTLEGALWANVPFIGPAVSPKSLNAFGEPALANETADKIFKLGVPIIFNIPTDRDSVNLHELVLKQGGGPSIPTRNQLAQRIDRQPTNKEYERFVKDYGFEISEVMKENLQELSEMSGKDYDTAMEFIGNNARDVAEFNITNAETP